MAELMKRTEEFRVDTEEQAETLIEDVKADRDNEGYVLSSYSSTKKTKKDDEWYVVKLVKVW